MTDKPYDIGESNARENDYWSQVHFPQLWICARCGITKDSEGAKMACSPDEKQHDWRHIS